MPKAALLVIDMQNDLCQDSRRKKKVRNIIDALKTTIELFTSRKLPIYYICFSLPKNDVQFSRFGDTYCIENTFGAEIISDLLPLRGQIIKKKKHSAFFETNLDEHLRQEDVKEVYFSGLQTQICIMTSAADASYRGYEPIVISDCVVSTRETNKTFALKWIKKYVGEVRTLTEVTEDLKKYDL